MLHKDWRLLAGRQDVPARVGGDAAERAAERRPQAEGALGEEVPYSRGGGQWSRCQSPQRSSHLDHSHNQLGLAVAIRGRGGRFAWISGLAMGVRGAMGV